MVPSLWPVAPRLSMCSAGCGARGLEVPGNFLDRIRQTQEPLPVLLDRSAARVLQDLDFWAEVVVPGRRLFNDAHVRVPQVPVRRKVTLAAPRHRLRAAEVYVAGRLRGVVVVHLLREGRPAEARDVPALADPPLKVAQAALHLARPPVIDCHA